MRAFGANHGWTFTCSHPLQQPAADGQRQRDQLRSGRLFELCHQLDTSQRLTDGRLIRSHRLARMEAVLMISRGGVSPRKLRDQAGLVDTKEVDQLVGLLNASYDATASAFRIETTATGYALMTRPMLVSWLDRLHQRQSQLKLSGPSMETLTIIAYQQPITRVGVEAIRGVQSSEMIRQLIDRGLVKVGGEEDSLGRPFLYITTNAFLDMFGISRISDLPDYGTIGRQPDPPKLADLPDSAEADDTEADDPEAAGAEAAGADAADSETESSPLAHSGEPDTADPALTTTPSPSDDDQQAA